MHAYHSACVCFQILEGFSFPNTDLLPPPPFRRCVPAALWSVIVLLAAAWGTATNAIPPTGARWGFTPFPGAYSKRDSGPSAD